MFFSQHGKAKRVLAGVLASAALIPACLFPGCGRGPDPETGETARTPILFSEDGYSLPEPDDRVEEAAPAIPEAASLARAGEIFWNGEEIPLYRRGEDGERYAEAAELASAAGSVLAEDGKGRLYIVHDRERDNRAHLNRETWHSEAAKEILLSSVTEEEILRGKIGDNSFIARVISKAKIDDVEK